MANRQLDRAFVDASYIIARFNRRDEHHPRARELAAQVAQLREMWTTDAVLLEVTASLAHPSTRPMSIEMWNQFHSGDRRYRVVDASSPNLAEAMNLYIARPDKAWSLTDCLSFIVMEREGLTDALTADEHFEQAGFRALLR